MDGLAAGRTLADRLSITNPAGWENITPRLAGTVDKASRFRLSRLAGAQLKRAALPPFHCLGKDVVVAGRSQVEGEQRQKVVKRPFVVNPAPDAVAGTRAAATALFAAHGRV